jgi:hypothetical protein
VLGVEKIFFNLRVDKLKIVWYNSITVKELRKMDRLSKEKYNSMIEKAILNYLQDYKAKYGFDFSINDEYDVLIFTKHFYKNYGLSPKKSKSFLKKVLTNK